MNDTLARIARRTARAQRRPGVEVVDRIDDPAAELSKDRAGTEAAMLLQRAGGEAEMDGGVGSLEEARRNRRDGMLHDRSPARRRSRDRGAGDAGAIVEKVRRLAGAAECAPSEMSPLGSSAAEEAAVTGCDHGLGLVAQALCPPALGRTFPFGGRASVEPRIDDIARDLALSATASQAVKYAQEQGQARTLERRHGNAGRRRAGRQPAKMTEQAARRSVAQLELIVDQQSDHHRSAGRAEQPQAMVSFGIVEDDMAAVLASPVGAHFARTRRIDRRRMIVALGRRAERQRRWRQLWAPDGGR